MNLRNFLDTTRQGEPIRLIHNTASIKSRLLFAVTPQSDFFHGNKGYNFINLYLSEFVALKMLYLKIMTSLARSFQPAINRFPRMTEYSTNCRNINALGTHMTSIIDLFF